MAGHWIGLAGAQRVGKTTLAEAYANKHGYRMCYTNITGIQKAIGTNSKVLNQSFEERVNIQTAILAAVTAMYREEYTKGGNCIWDRTPYDFITYMFLSITADTTPEQWELLREYRNTCKALLMYFDSTFIVLPGIPLVEDGKSLCNEAYIHKFTSFILGESRTDTDNHVIPGFLLKLDNRITYMENIINA